MSVSHNAQREPTRVYVRTVLEALPHRVEELLMRHESSHELGFEAVEQALHALFTQAECAALGHMMPSKSLLDRLPKALSARWEVQRCEFEARVREDTLEVPDTACIVAVSLDGVMAPMRGGGGGYREAGCASVSLHDGEGARLSTVRMARMPQPKKGSLETMMAAEVEAMLDQRPNLDRVESADGASQG